MVDTGLIGKVMDIAEFLAPQDVLVDMRATDKKALLGELSRHAGAALSLDPALLSAELLKREDLGSTGLGDGVALPHTRLAQLKKPFAALARLRRGMMFDAIDGQPVDLVVLLLLPASGGADQMNALASVARKLRDKDVRQNLRSATDAMSAYRAMTEQSPVRAK